MRTLTRRDFLRASVGAAATATLAACVAPTAVPPAAPAAPTTAPAAATTAPPAAAGGGWPADFKARSEEWKRLPADHKAGDLITQADWYKILGDPPKEEIEYASWLEGWGMAWKDEVKKLLIQEHPSAQMKIWSDPRIQTSLQPRLVAGDIPDAGYAWFSDTGGYIQATQNGVVVPLDILLDLEAYGQPGKRVGDVMSTGSQKAATMGLPHMFYAPFVQTQVGLYYNPALYEKNGWTTPENQTWEEWMDQNQKIKDSGIAPLAFQGNVAGYIECILPGMVYKWAGDQAICDIDNLKPNAWLNPDVIAAFDACQEINKKGFFYPGSEALGVTDGQQPFFDGKTAMVMSGSWLKREMEKTTPPGFRMKIAPVPAPKNAKGFAKALRNDPGGAVSMVGNGKHPLWGIEFTRLTLSPQLGKYVAESMGAMISLKDPLGTVKAEEALQSQIDAVKAAEGHYLDIHSWNISDILKPLRDQEGDFVYGKIASKDILAKVERASQEYAADASKIKYPSTDCKY